MKKLIVLMFVFSLIGLIVSGCAIKYTELTKETFPRLNASKVTEVDVVSTLAGKEPNKWRGIYRNVFPIKDERINTIFNCIRDANSIDYYTDRKILFKTWKGIYFIGIGWDDKFVYGDWWESKDLLMYFKQWGFELPKGEPNLPPGQILTEDPFHRDPNVWF